MEPNHIELLTSLTPTECVLRLSSAIDAERSVLFSTAGWSGPKPVIGWVTGSSLRLRKRIGYRNSFQNFLRASIRQEANGTVISGVVAMHPLVRAFMYLWLGGVILIGGVVFVATVGSMFFGPVGQQQNIWLGIVVPPAMLAFGFALIRFGRYKARNEARFLMDFLVQTLDAHKRN